MSSNNDTIGKTIIVTVLLCVICSVVVSAAAVMLKPMQVANKDLDRKSNILAAAGISDPSKSVDELFEQITTRYVDLQTGHFVDEPVPNYDAYKAAKDPQMGHALRAISIPRPSSSRPTSCRSTWWKTMLARSRN